MKWVRTIGKVMQLFAALVLLASALKIAVAEDLFVSAFFLLLLGQFLSVRYSKEERARNLEQNRPKQIEHQKRIEERYGRSLLTKVTVASTVVALVSEIYFVVALAQPAPKWQVTLSGVTVAAAVCLGYFTYLPKAEAPPARSP